MLDLDPAREGPTPRDAATLVAVRDAHPAGLEVFCVERQKVGFLGGAIVFPGGKLDPDDVDERWIDRVTPPVAPHTPIAPDAATLRGLAIAACREALEEGAILPVAGGALAHAERLEWRARVARKESTLRALLEARALRLDLASLHPMARWITPASESRRFDARFFLFVAGDSDEGAHDDRETTASFWATPRELLRRFVAREIQLAPPTHRTIEVLASARDARDALVATRSACLDPICPRLVAHHDSGGDTIALVLPGDPEHDVPARRVPGTSRYVLRGDRFLPEDP